MTHKCHLIALVNKNVSCVFLQLNLTLNISGRIKIFQNILAVRLLLGYYD